MNVLPGSCFKLRALQKPVERPRTFKQQKIKKGWNIYLQLRI